MHNAPDTTTNFDALYDRLASWRRWMVRRYPTFDDIASVIDASLWEQHLAGVTDLLALRRTAETAVRRHVRKEVTFNKLRQVRVAAVEESFEDQITNAVAAGECVRQLDIPERAWSWLRRFDQPGEYISNGDECYGRRWAARARKELSDVA